MPNYGVSAGLHSIQYNDVFENPSGFITKCYSFEGGMHRDCEQKFVFLTVCARVVFFVSVCVGFCVIVRVTQSV